MPGPDLVSAGYPITHPFRKLLGGAVNATQGNLSVRSNAEWFGLGNPTDGALAASGLICSVAVPVEIGDVFTKMSMVVGATAASTPTHSFGALYTGVATGNPTKVVQSTDGTTAAIAASALFTFTFAATTITTTNAPNGYVYASISVTGTAVNTAMVVSTPTAIGYQWFTTGGPLFLSATHDSAVAGTAPATMGSTTAKAVAPIVFLY